MKEYIDKKDVQEKDEESSHQRKTKLQGIKYKKIQSKNKQTLYFMGFFLGTPILFLGVAI